MSYAQENLNTAIAKLAEAITDPVQMRLLAAVKAAVAAPSAHSPDPTQERTGHTAAEQAAYWRGFEQAQLNAQHNAKVRSIPTGATGEDGDCLAAFQVWYDRRGVWPRLTYEEIFSAGWNARPAPAAGDALPRFDIEAAAQKMAECMDYPWAEMPEQGRAQMRKFAQSVIDAAIAQQKGEA